MRCIETFFYLPLLQVITLINSNMRCIETENGAPGSRLFCMINSNMRCIETCETFLFMCEGEEDK